MRTVNLPKWVIVKISKYEEIYGEKSSFHHFHLYSSHPLTRQKKITTFISQAYFQTHTQAHLYIAYEYFNKYLFYL